ncbi:MAG TPA: xanthine dehydrogenase family protein molybdopterin-binding subunit [Terriglobia bacterium]|nr:xanthine dehydrogenase family protein molybdopterin-binding subunit [Terriglobia bacterium]
MATTKLLGKRIKRKEDPRLIQGRGHFVDDIKLDGMLHMAFARSPYGHARIISIQTEAARNAHGVLSVLTGDDLKGKLGPVPCAAGMEGLKVPAHPCLAGERVRYVGEPVAAVVATNRYLAADAAAQVVVEYDMLPAVTGMDKALESGSPRVHESFGDNVAFVARLEGGDWKTVAADPAIKVIKQRLINQRVGPMAMETRGVVASYSPGEDTLTVWSSTQIPHLLKTQLSLMTQIDEPRCRVIAPEVGGAFGSKLNVYGEEGVACLASKLLGRPVKWIEGRRENLAGTIHGRDQIDDVEVYFQPDGKVVGLKCRVLADMGAYFQLLTPAIPTSTALMILGCYDIKNVSVETIGVFTNKIATDAYRGAGRPEATYIIERAMNMVAQELNLDPVDVRLKNFPAPGKDITLATGVSYDTANYQKTLKKVLKLSGYSKLRKEQQRLRKKGRLLGIGLSTYVEICAMGPSSRMPAGGWESGTVRVEVTGKVTVLTGVSPHGQGEQTSFAQIVAQELDIPFDDVTVFHGDTAQVPMGIGTFGSRATAVGGSAVYVAAQRVKKKMARIAAHKLGVKPGELVFEEGNIQTKDGSKSVTFKKVAEEAYMARELPPGMEPGLSELYVFEPPNFTYPFGAHVAVTEIDPKTGEVRLRNYFAVDDCGRILNPMLVDGQVHGGIAQGAGQALVEEIIYDENGQLITGTLMDYAVPKAHQFPWFETAHTETRTPVNPLGVKGVGEAGTIGSTPAIVNAVVDALGPLGVRHIDMPLKPEKIWDLIKHGAAPGGHAS